MNQVVSQHKSNGKRKQLPHHNRREDTYDSGTTIL